MIGIVDNKRVIYLAGAFWHDDKKIRNKRFKTLSKVAGKLMKEKDIYVYSPISHGVPIDATAKLDHAFWVQFSLKMLAKCNEIYVLDVDGWKESKGVQAEINWAKEFDMPIHMITTRGRVYRYED